MKKKRKFILKKLLQTGSIIFAIIIVIIFLIHRLTYKEENKPVVSSIETNENVLVVEVTQPKIESKITDWNLILVNKENQIPEGYSYQLQTIEGKHQVDTKIAEPLTKMLEEARKQGLKPMICSSYRTLHTQTTLYNQKVRQYRTLGYEERNGTKRSLLLGNTS